VGVVRMKDVASDADGGGRSYPQIEKDKE